MAARGVFFRAFYPFLEWGRGWVGMEVTLWGGGWGQRVKLGLSPGPPPWRSPGGRDTSESLAMTTTG